MAVNMLVAMTQTARGLAERVMHRPDDKWIECAVSSAVDVDTLRAIAPVDNHTFRRPRKLRATMGVSMGVRPGTGGAADCFSLEMISDWSQSWMTWTTLSNGGDSIENQRSVLASSVRATHGASVKLKQ